MWVESGRMIAFLSKALLVALLVNLVAVDAQGKKPKPSVQKEDLPYIQCEVCERTAKAIYDQISAKRDALPSPSSTKPTSGKKKKNVGPQLQEEAIVDVLENICDASKTEGQWIRHLDIVERKGQDNYKYLFLDEPGGMGKCGKECATIVHACESLLSDDNLEELSAKLWKNSFTSVQDLQDKMCRKMTKRCTKRQKALSSKSKPRSDEKFSPQSEKDVEMEKLMAQMQASGLGGGNVHVFS